MIHPDYIRLNRILAGIIFLISFIVYFDTMAPTVSYWDCGEFIAVSYTLGVPHPPGSPFFLLLGRIATMIPISDDIAYRVNILSPLVSALAVMFLYLIIVQVVVQWRRKLETINDALVAFGGAVVGSLVFAFTDSHWFNAVEAEVYAMSTFFTAIVVWLILHWYEKADEKGHERYILIIAYMIGLATGLHLLNLLTLPFVALIIYFRKYRSKVPHGSVIGHTENGERVYQEKTVSFNFILSQSFWMMVFITGVVFFIIHNVIIKGLPKIAASFIGVGGTALLILAIFGGMVWAIVEKRKIYSVVLSSMVLILIGYSTYALIFIRSNQNPGIDENDPETVEAFISYLEREQYGPAGMFPRRFKGIPPIHEVAGYPKGGGRNYTSSQKKKYMAYEIGKQWDYFWNYQIGKMYNRYFLWQFAGKGLSTELGVTSMGANKREEGVDWTQFGLPLAFILGLIGMFYHAYRDEKMAFSVMTLFLMTGYAVIFYLNQDNPQPRERDYSYVGSFFAFSIWVGIGASAISEKIIDWVNEKEFSKRLVTFALLLQVIFIPGVMANANYHSHDRSGNFVAWDYSYNILQSCEPNAVVFTNGDNDTFPLWYLQEVEKVRTDVAVVNLSLLNTPWYIKQWRDNRSKETRFINLTDHQIDRLTSNLTPWKKQKVKVPVHNDPKNKLGYIEWSVKPTYGNQALKVQDMMILRIISDSKWRIPIYFAVTVSQQNRIGLSDYLAMNGLTFKLKSHKTALVDLEKMGENLLTDIGHQRWSREFDQTDFNKTTDLAYLSWSRDYQPGYMFRNLGNGDVYYNQQVNRLLQNYRSAYMQLAVTHYRKYQLEGRKENNDQAKLTGLREKTLAALDKMRQNIPEETIPIQSEEFHFNVAILYGDLDRKDDMRAILDALVERESGKPKNRIEYANMFFNGLNDTTTSLRILEGMRNQFLQMESMVKTGGIGKNAVKGPDWDRWQKAYPDIISSLVYVYRKSGNMIDAEMVLMDWIDRYPSDKKAQKILKEIQSQG